jgi:hypothetical protein
MTGLQQSTTFPVHSKLQRMQHKSCECADKNDSRRSRRWFVLSQAVFLHLDTPASPSNPEVKSHTLAGSGTARGVSR